jgi:hypothetical protein
MKSLQVLSFLQSFSCSQDSYPLANVGRRMFAMSSQCPRASRSLVVSRSITLLKTSIDVEYRCSNRLTLRSGVQDEGDNQAVWRLAR